MDDRNVAMAWCITKCITHVFATTHDFSPCLYSNRCLLNHTQVHIINLVGLEKAVYGSSCHLKLLLRYTTSSMYLHFFVFIAAYIDDIKQLTGFYQ